MKRSAWTSLLLASLLLTFGIFTGCSDDTVSGLTGQGRIGVYPQPNTEAYPWTLTGPGGYSYDGAGDEVIEDLDSGEYTLAWGELNGWVAPSPLTVTKTLQAGSFTSFTATYRPSGGEAQPGQVIINPNPDELNAPWTLEGPNGYTLDGTGDEVLEDLELGDYLITRGAVLGWETPEPQTGTLIENQGLNFDAEYLSLSASSFVFVDVDPGTFNMGSPRTEAGAMPFEWPQHQVTLSQGFSMSITEVTWAQFERVMGYNPSYFFEQNPEYDWPSHPVDSVTWLEAIEFCNTLSEDEELTPVYQINGDLVTWDRNADGYRLPTEAEWEFACRAGTSSPLYNGNFEMQASSCYFEPTLAQIAWYCETSPSFGIQQLPSETAQLDPNANGLFDMSGNVWEWVWDVNDNYDGVPMLMGAYDDGVEEMEDGNATIVAELSGLGHQHVMRLQSTNVTFAVDNLGLTTSEVRLSYLDFGTVSNLRINNEDLYIGELAAAPASPAPGVTMSITTTPTSHETFGEGVLGEIVLTGDVGRLEIGGEFLWIDDLEVVDAAGGDFALDRSVDFDLINLNSVFRPDGDDFSIDLLLGCTVTDPIGSVQAAGAGHMLRGGSYANEPRRCRSASRSEPDKSGRYAGFRFVRTLF